MANPPKQKGTKRETAVVAAHEELGLVAHRDENNSKTSDVIVRPRGLRPIRLEVKDRQNLNAHKLMRGMAATYPGEFIGLWWHRTSRKNGNSRLSPDGPDLIHLPVDQWLQLAVLIDRVGAAMHEQVDPDADPDHAVRLLEWIIEALPAGLVRT